MRDVISIILVVTFPRKLEAEAAYVVAKAAVARVNFIVPVFLVC